MCVSKKVKQVRYVGKRIGKLIILKTANKHGSVYWCKCDCGNVVKIRYKTIKRGLIKDCGCGDICNRKVGKLYGTWEVICKDKLAKDKTIPRWLCRCTKCDRVQSLTSGELNINRLGECLACKKSELEKAKNSRIHNIWMCMKARCKGTGGQNTVRYYAGRGIKYQESWKRFENFYNDMKDGYADNLQLDRIDPDGDYTKENCRWITAKENCRNRRDNTIVTAGGETHVQAWWMEKYGLSSSSSLPKRLQRDYGDDWEIVHGHRQNWLPTPRYHI